MRAFHQIIIDLSFVRFCSVTIINRSKTVNISVKIPKVTNLRERNVLIYNLQCNQNHCIAPSEVICSYVLPLNDEGKNVFCPPPQKAGTFSKIVSLSWFSLLQPKPKVNQHNLLCILRTHNHLTGRTKKAHRIQKNDRFGNNTYEYSIAISYFKIALTKLKIYTNHTNNNNDDNNTYIYSICI